MKIYLDHHATTPCDPAVVTSMAPYWSEEFGNAASRSHTWGLTARQATERARGQLSLRLGCSPKEIVFTSGATEANNLAVLGVLRAGQRRRLVTVATEHKAILDPAQQLVREGFEVTVLPVQADGRVDPEAVRAAMGPDVALLSVMWANNETGVLQPLAQLVEIAHAAGALVHTDAAQALATEAIDLRALDVDLLSCSAHKAYGPKGVGALVVRHRRPAIPLQPLLFGGGHERGLRSGTLPVPLLVGFGAAVDSFDPTDVERIRGLRDHLWSGLEALGGIRLNGSAQRLPNNLNLTIDGVESKALLLGCPDLAMSSGSACTSASLEPSHVLRAMGLHEQSGNTVRIGLGRCNDAEQIGVALAELRSKITEIRALTAL